MLIDELIEEGRRLSRPCTLLLADGEDSRRAATWGGKGPSNRRPSGAAQHWLTIDGRFLPVDLKLGDGSLSIYTGDDGESGAAVWDPTPGLPEDAGGMPLFAHDAMSFPPIDAIPLRGGAAFRSEEIPHELAGEYDRYYAEACPLYSEGIHAVLRGWHFPWPDGDWEELIDHRLIAWTLADSEPWVEVWERGGAFRVIERIT